jgi:hypothetical protein
MSTTRPKGFDAARLHLGGLDGDALRISQHPRPSSSLDKEYVGKHRTPETTPSFSPPQLQAFTHPHELEKRQRNQHRSDFIWCSKAPQWLLSWIGCGKGKSFIKKDLQRGVRKCQIKNCSQIGKIGCGRVEALHVPEHGNKVCNTPARFFF